MTEVAEWTEEDEAFANFVSDLACEISADEDVVHDVLGALMERGLFDKKAVLASPSVTEQEKT